MKTILLLTFLVAFLAISCELSCPMEDKLENLSRTWINMNKDCEIGTMRQIHKEVNASITYLTMGAHFSRDSPNRPGFAKLFFEAASKERHHAMKLIEYLLMRGKLTKDIEQLIFIKEPYYPNWRNGLHALENSLLLETDVTSGITNLIKTCESPKSNFVDYHFVDYLTKEFLGEQLKGHKDLIDKVSILRRMMYTEGNFAEFIFDKKLLGLDMVHK